MQTALKYQPRNQRYALRIAEIYIRQAKFAEAQNIADKIAQTADEPQLAAQAKNLGAEIRQMQQSAAEQDKIRQQYETARQQAAKDGGNPRLVRRTEEGVKTVSAEEATKANQQAETRWINQSLRKTQPNEKQIFGRIQSIECKGKNITYAVKSNEESFTLSSTDFQSLTINSFSRDASEVEIGCNAKLAELAMVLTYEPLSDAKSRGELLVIEFVPKFFQLMTTAELESELEPNPNENIPNITAANGRAGVFKLIKKDLRKPQTGEKQELGFLDKTECVGRTVIFYIKTRTQTLKLTSGSPQSINIRAFTPEIGQLQFGCQMKPLDIPVVFIYRDTIDLMSDAKGEILSLEFVPKDFTLEN